MSRIGTAILDCPQYASNGADLCESLSCVLYGTRNAEYNEIAEQYERDLATAKVTSLKVRRSLQKEDMIQSAADQIAYHQNREVYCIDCETHHSNKFIVGGTWNPNQRRSMCSNKKEVA
jgi:hypothetical protein